jgi:hypothetical protein
MKSLNPDRHTTIKIEFILPQRVPSLPAACLMPVAQRWLAAQPSCALDMLYVACVWLVHDAVVPREVYRLK